MHFLNDAFTPQKPHNSMEDLGPLAKSGNWQIISVKSVCNIVKAQVLAPETAIKSAADAIYQQSEMNRTHTKNHFKLKKGNKDQIFCNFICEM